MRYTSTNFILVVVWINTSFPPRNERQKQIEAALDTALDKCSDVSFKCLLSPETAFEQADQKKTETDVAWLDTD